jgi:hypothetical protein
MGYEPFQQWVFRLMGLNPNLARAFCATGSTCHLHDQLSCSFWRPKVRAKKTGVSVHHGNEGHLRKVVSLCQHLGADHDAGSTLVNLLQLTIELVRCPGGIPVNPIQGNAGE